jgi:hypothetical protein
MRKFDFEGSHCLWSKFRTSSGGGIMYPKTFSTLTYLFVFLIPALVFGQERPETIIIPVSSLGEVNETRKQILQNTLEEQLKRYFKLVSQERFLKAQESAFEDWIMRTAPKNNVSC